MPPSTACLSPSLLLRAPLAAVFLGLLPAAAAAAAPGGLSITDDRGHRVEFAQVPQRIVSLLPSLTETVCALGECARLVGVDRYANWPAAIDALPRVGGIDDAQVERIVALRPDLVLLRSRSRAADRLEALGIRVLALDARTHADIRRVMETVARVMGRPGAGEATWRRLDAHLDAARARIPAAWQGQRVYVELHGGAAAAGPGSFIGETLQRLGLHNVVPAGANPFPKLGPEFVVRADPDVLIAMNPADLATLAARRPGWSAMRAVREGRYCGFADGRDDLLLRAGPRLDAAANAIVDCLQSLQ